MIMNRFVLSLIGFKAVVLTLTMAFSALVFAEDMATRVGSFSGMNNHVTTGEVQVVTKGEVSEIVFSANFSFDGAPDPKVAFGKDGKYDPATLIAPLASNTGEQTYSVPASLDLSKYNEVYIWCEKFSVGLGVAPISSP